MHCDRRNADPINMKGRRSGAALQAPGRGARFGEVCPLDLGRDGLVLGAIVGGEGNDPTFAVHIVGSVAGDSLVGSRFVVPASSRREQIGEMIHAANEGHSSEPFALEGPVNPLCHGDRTMLADGPEDVLDTMASEKLFELRAREGTALIGDELSRPTV